MKLADYMRHNDISPERFAETLGGVSVSGVRKWMSDTRVPRKDQIEKIAELTHGAVLPNDFFSLSTELLPDASQATAADPDSAPRQSGPAVMEAAE
jgi:hypothetical protein